MHAWKSGLYIKRKWCELRRPHFLSLSQKRSLMRLVSGVQFHLSMPQLCAGHTDLGRQGASRRKVQKQQAGGVVTAPGAPPPLSGPAPPL